MKPWLPLLCMLALLMQAPQLRAQILSDNAAAAADGDSVRHAFDAGPYFGLYKDNYFIFGPPVNHRPTSRNTNIKFQISISQRLTRSTLPWGTYLYLFYTQKVFWNVLERSMPMTDLNFNPGIGLTKPLFVNNRYIGKVTLMAEHESNGRNGLSSRSWNHIALAGSIMVAPQLTVHGKAWIPIIDGENNRDILKYCGIFQTGVTMQSTNGRFGAAVTLVKRQGWNLNFNTIIELNVRLWRRDNQFLFMQFYNGYGEGLLAYKEFHSMLRVGIVIKPTLFSEF